MSLFVYREFCVEDLMGSDCRLWAEQGMAEEVQARCWCNQSDTAGGME